MIAGVILGPSLFGLLAPDLQHMLFPKDTKAILYFGAQLGVGLYMFLVGLGFDRSHFRSNAKSAGAVSISGMAAPFLIAILMTPWLMGVPGLFSPKLTLFQATLFMGACISITAFPMLARIIHERGLSKSPLGTLSLSAGAIDDAGAWTVLAIVLVTFGGGPSVAMKAIAGVAAFAVLMIGFGPRLLASLGRAAERAKGVSQTLLGIVLMLFLLSAFAMDWVGMHAVFGGFLLGTAMPRGILTRELRAKLEPFTVVLLLPMFFTFSGLNTQLNLVANPSLLLVALAILAAAILAKGGACWAAARITGQDNATALGIGALMNARCRPMLMMISSISPRAFISAPMPSAVAIVLAGQPRRGPAGDALGEDRSGQDRQRDQQQAGFDRPCRAGC